MKDKKDAWLMGRNFETWLGAGCNCLEEDMCSAGNFGLGR